MTPVVSAALGALGPLLVKLAGLLAGEYGRLKGVGREIRSLQSELTSMHAALQEYTELEDPSGQVKAWISLVRELAYDTEDVFDKFIHQIRKGGHRGGFKGFLRKITLPLKKLGARRGIADQIDDLKVRIEQVKDLKDCYKLNDAPSSTTRHTTLDPRLHAVFADEAHLVGMEGPRDDLAKWMMEENNTSKQCKVLSIVGFGGLGKTTLANEVYRKIEEQFHCRAFVSVSQKPDLKKIIKDVISQMPIQDGSMKDTRDWDENKSIAKLKEMLQDKRYLIVIDDVWSKQAWSTIKCAFPENNCSSRIIATTRIIDVAKSCCPSIHDRLYKMEALSDLHSRRLFFKRIFGCDDHCPDMLKQVSTEIIKKCGGLPLAIISISSLLANRSATEEEWVKVKRSIGPALDNNQSLDGMNSILSLSYNDLPPNLKTCLLYLSVFPEDSEIDRVRLVRKWIAEGFISEERGQSQQDVAENYFYELINKSMLQPVDIGVTGKVRACRVHDMMLEIIISKSLEENFVTLVGRGQTSLRIHHGFIRRLSVQHIDQELAYALANEDLSHVRSLTVTSSCCLEYLPSLVEFEALRVLDFEGCQGLEKYDMTRVDKLFQLKYFSLQGTDISKLPSRIVMLSNLETLDFWNTSVQELPAGFVQLTKLQYLLGGRQTQIPSGIGIMRNLRVISCFNGAMSPSDALEELGNLISLHELKLYVECEGSKCGGTDKYKMHEEKLFSSLRKLIGSSKLLSLCISTDSDYSIKCMEAWLPIRSALQSFHMFTNYYFRSVPKFIAPALASLTSLDINLFELTKDGLHTLAELPALLCLFLTLETAENEIAVQGIGFPSLKQFEIACEEGTYVTFVKGAMPRLEYLVLKLAVLVARKHGFYLGIVHLPRLKYVSINVFSPSSLYIVDAVIAIDKEEGAHNNNPIFNIY